MCAVNARQMTSPPIEIPALYLGALMTDSYQIAGHFLALYL